MFVVATSYLRTWRMYVYANAKLFVKVVNFDIPDDLNSFAHRVGHLGLANNGTVTTFYDPTQSNSLLFLIQVSLCF